MVHYTADQMMILLVQDHNSAEILSASRLSASNLASIALARCLMGLTYTLVLSLYHNRAKR